MIINAMAIESLGGLIYNPLEPNTPDIPEIDGVEVGAILFNGHGVFRHEDKYYKLTYQKLEDIEGKDQTLRAINQHRYGYRLPDDFEITVDDMAVTFGETEEIEYSEYVSCIVEGLIDNSGRMIVEGDLTPFEYEQKLRAIEKSPPKYLHIYTDFEELVEELDGKIYPVYDENKKELCDVLLEDLIELETSGDIRARLNDDDLNDVVISAVGNKEKVLATRFEAILFNKRK